MSFYKREVNLILLEMKKGNIESRTDLIKLTYKPLKKIARKYLLNKTNVADVLQSSYLKVFQYIKSFDEEKDGYNWLCRIVQHVAYDYNKREKETLIFEENYYAINSSETEYEKILLRDEVEYYMSPYTEADKELIRLRFKGELSYREIAEMKGMKLSSVHKRISKIFKEVLEKEERRTKR